MSDADSESELVERVRTVIMQEIPQIQMHGGEAYVDVLDRSEGEIRVQLTDNCHGCGLAPMTEKALEKRLIQEIDEVERVVTSTEPLEQTGRSSEQAPF